jgi:DNA primase
MSRKPSLPFIDYAAVKAATTIEMVLQHYGLVEKMKPKGPDGLRGCCPVHHGTDDSQFSVTLSKNLWRCFSPSGCVSGGNHLDLVMRLEDCTLHEAAWRMNDWFNLGQEKQTEERTRSNRPASPSKERTTPAKSDRKSAPASPEPTAPDKPTAPEEETGENIPLAFSLKNLDAAHPYLTERGLMPETIAEFGLGFCPKGIMAGRIAIPIHNMAGELIGNAGRWPGDPPEGKEKYRLPGGFKKTLELFNGHRAALEPDTSPLIIVEGFFPLMHLWQHGFRRVVSLMGWFLSERQEELIGNLVTQETRLVLMLDNDEAGHAARIKIAPRLAEHCFVRSFRWPEGVSQPDDLTADQLAELR